MPTPPLETVKKSQALTFEPDQLESRSLAHQLSLSLAVLMSQHSIFQLLQFWNQFKFIESRPSRERKWDPTFYPKIHFFFRKNFLTFVLDQLEPRMRAQNDRKKKSFLMSLHRTFQLNGTLILKCSSKNSNFLELQKSSSRIQNSNSRVLICFQSIGNFLAVILRSHPRFQHVQNVSYGIFSEKNIKF